MLKNFMDLLIYILLGLTSIVGLTFIVERSLALRWNKVVPQQIATSLETCQTAEDLEALRVICPHAPPPLGRLFLLASRRSNWPDSNKVAALKPAARHEIVR